MGDTCSPTRSVNGENRHVDGTSMPSLMTWWGGGPLSPLGTDTPAASGTSLALRTGSSCASVSGLAQGETCFATLWFLSLLL